MSRRADGGTGGRLAATVAGVLTGVLVFLLIVAGLLLVGTDSEGDPGALLAGTPLTPSPTAPAAPVTATAAPTGTATPTPAATPTATPTPAPTVEPTQREPTDADAAAFTSAFEPPDGEDVESVTVDLDGDGRPEVVFVSVAGGAVRLDVGSWTGRAYEVVFSDAGGPAEEIDRFEVRDLGGDGLRQIAVVARYEEFETLSVWGWDGDEIARHEAEGGCWDGSHVYGATGVELRRGQIAATCDDAGMGEEGRVDVYVWDGSAWRHDRTEGR